MSLPLLKKLRKSKVKLICIVKTWDEFFCVKAILATLLPMLHIFDIIHLTQISRQTYVFYNSTKIAKILCPIVHRDLGESYKSSPLKFINKNRTTKFKENKWSASKCSSCNGNTTSMMYRYTDRKKYSVCYHCSIYKSYARKYIELIVKNHHESNRDRIERIIMRNAKTIFQMMEQRKQDQVENFLIHEISCLDLFVPIPIVHIKLKPLESLLDPDWDLSYPLIDCLEDDSNPRKRTREDWEISLTDIPPSFPG